MTKLTRNIEGDGSLRRKSKLLKIDEEDANNAEEVKRVSTTYERKQVQELDLQGLSKEDIASLQNSDPFLFYSIPAVRSAKVALSDDYSDVEACVSSTSRSTSRKQERQRPATKVSRRTRISFEAHSSLLMADLLKDLQDDGDDASDDDGDDFLLDLFCKLAQ